MKDIYYKGCVINGYDRRGELYFSSRCAEGKGEFISLMERAWATEDVVEVKVIFVTNPIEQENTND